MQRFVVAILNIAILAAVAACSAPDTDRARTLPDQPAATATSNAAPDKIDLNATLLTLKDMPTGFTPDTSSPTGDDDSGCEPLDKADAGEQSGVEASFTKGDFGPFIEQSLAQLPIDRAQRSMDQLATVLDKCRTITDVNEDGTKIRFRLSGLSFPRIGDDTFAFRMKADSNGFTMNADVVAIRRGGVLTLIVHLGLGAIDSALTEKIARKALTKIDAALKHD